MTNEFSFKRFGLIALVSALPLLHGCGSLKSSETSVHYAPRPAATQGFNVKTNVSGKIKAPEVYNTRWNLKGKCDISVVGSDSIKTALEGIVIGGRPYLITTNNLFSVAKTSGVTNELPFELIEADKGLTRVYNFDRKEMTPKVEHTHVPQLVLLSNGNLATTITLSTNGPYAVSAKMPDLSQTDSVDAGTFTLQGEPNFGLKTVSILGEDYFAPLTDSTIFSSRYLMPLKGASANILPDGSIKLRRPEGFYRLNQIEAVNRHPAAQTNSLIQTNIVQKNTGAAGKID